MLLWTSCCQPLSLAWPPSWWCPTTAACPFPFSCGSGEGPAGHRLGGVLAWSGKSNLRGGPGCKILIISVGKVEAGEAGWHTGWVSNTELQNPGNVLRGRGLWPSALRGTVLKLKPLLLCSWQLLQTLLPERGDGKENRARSRLQMAWRPPGDTALLERDEGKGEEHVASGGTDSRHAPVWLLAGKEPQEVPPPPFLLCMREPACIVLCCPVSKTAEAAPWRYKEMTISLDACRRMSKANARAEDMPWALLHYVGC